ncbi:MAG: trypsin-like peptidase domain-containing protein [Clostridia bacterium]|nr:trypsin-like peptidase domain-containing protein [Clostridia bacterium]
MEEKDILPEAQESNEGTASFHDIDTDISEALPQEPTQLEVELEESCEQVPQGEDAEPEISLDWKFGATASRAPAAQPGKKEGKRFFGVFGAVIAICMALLVVTLFLGDTGIKIYRTLTNERTVFVKEYDNGDSGLLAPEQAADVIKKSTVTVSVRTQTGTAIGSGFIYTADGYICTNHHVVENAVTVQVILPDGEAVDATVVGTDEMADLAVLKINKTGLSPVKIGRSATALVGESVVAVGTPAKLDYAGTATFGKISATNRIVALTDDSGVVNKKMTVLQTDASVNPGNSGGPLANMYGEVIGVVVMKVSYFGGTVFDGIGFAIPIDGARIVIDAIIANGKFEGENPIATGRSLLGVTGRGVVGGYWYSDLTADSVSQSETEKAGYTYMPYDGVYVINVSGANAVEKLQQGDVITKINGLNMYTVYDIINQVNRFPANQTVTLTVKRPDGAEYRELNIDIVLLSE